ncbi:MAG: N-formylglutamate amidohydrolase [Alphaproteobacteria bacterium]
MSVVAHRPHVYDIVYPQDITLPLILDSPHSGTLYPSDFRAAAPLHLLQQGEDRHVDDLYHAAPSHGATFLKALFPRVYIDANRHIDDLDASLIDGAWPTPLKPGEKTALGQGLIWKKCANGLAIYDRQLTITETQARINNYYLPYHQTLRSLIEAAHQKFNTVWHINCHSMPSISSSVCKEGPGHRRPDFTLGDRFGTTCSPEFTLYVKSILEDLGYYVTTNDPYAGAELVRAYSHPPSQRHSLQIEINRALYMDECSFCKTAGFDQLQENLHHVLSAIERYVKKNI